MKLKQHQQLHTGIYHFGYNHKIAIYHFGFHHRSGIVRSKLFTLKSVRENVYSRDKHFICFLCCKQLRTSDDKNNHLNTHCSVKFQPQENAEKTLPEINLIQNVQMQPLANLENSFCVINVSKHFHAKVT